MSKLKCRPLPFDPEWDAPSVPAGTVPVLAGKQMIFEFEQVYLYGEPSDLDPEAPSYSPSMRKCSVCGDYTEQCCSDCMIDTGKRVYVCSMSECMDEHEGNRCSFPSDGCWPKEKKE